MPWYEVSWENKRGFIRSDFVIIKEQDNSKPTDNSKSVAGSDINGIATDLPSINLIYMIKESEGFAPSRYPDSGGVITDGYGLTKDEITKFPDSITEEFATQKLAEHVANGYYKTTLRYIKEAGVKNPLQREVDAFTDFMYNEGPENFRTSTLLKVYASGERGEKILDQLLRWKYYKKNNKFYVLQGLLNRRKKEWHMFTGDQKVSGYTKKPEISIINRHGYPTNKIVESNGGYGAAPKF